MTTITPTPRVAADRALPWDAMGSQIAGEFASVDEALAARGLDYRVRMTGAQAVEEDGTVIAAPGARAIVRPMPGGSDRVLAFASERYVPIQNRDAFAVADTLVEEHGARIVGAADYRNGRRSLLAVEVGKPIRVTLPDGQEDRTDLYLLFVNSHDGSHALTATFTPVRFACTNALTGALRAGVQTWRVSHTASSPDRVAAAHDAILAAVDYRAEFERIAQQMVETKVTQRQVHKMVETVWPLRSGATERVKANTVATHDAVRSLWKTSETLDGIRGTAWGAYNAMTEYVDWSRTTRDDRTRAERSLAGRPVRVKARAWDAALAVL